MDNKVTLVEVGPRDGLQNESSIVDTDVKFEFIKLLHDAGLNVIEITSFVRPDKIPQMKDASDLYNMVVDNIDLSNLRTPCLVPNLKGLETAMKLNVSEIAIFTATSNTFNIKNINATVDESFQRLSLVSDKAREVSLDIRGYLSTVFGCPYEGIVKKEQVIKTIDKLLKLGVYEVSLGDTIGVANPEQVRSLILEIKKNFDLSKMAMHFHDTEGMALANIYASYEEGIRVFDSSAAGLGGCPYAKGATGNVATDDIVNLFHKIGVNTGVDQDKLHKASSYILNHLKKNSPSKYFNAREGRKA
ncbi:MAG: hydroxymethylglutaryl-CoA lyase [Bacteriovorax sp. MedPE-SWde]|nr:MAG: hydroxymethylglutaryl-CoA lyase [Bacteriovorax sp. MedPE-SWde]